MVARLGDLPAALFLEDVHVARVVQRARSKSRATKFRTAYVCVHFGFLVSFGLETSGYF